MNSYRAMAFGYCLDCSFYLCFGVVAKERAVVEGISMALRWHKKKSKRNRENVAQVVTNEERRKSNVLVETFTRMPEYESSQVRSQLLF